MIKFPAGLQTVLRTRHRLSRGGSKTRKSGFFARDPKSNRHPPLSKTHRRVTRPELNLLSEKN